MAAVGPWSECTLIRRADWDSTLKGYRSARHSRTSTHAGHRSPRLNGKIWRLYLQQGQCEVSLLYSGGRQRSREEQQWLKSEHRCRGHAWAMPNTGLTCGNAQGRLPQEAETLGPAHIL